MHCPYATAAAPSALEAWQTIELLLAPPPVRRKKLETSDGKQQALQEAVDLVQGELAEQRARLETIQGTCKQLVQVCMCGAAVSACSAARDSQSLYAMHCHYMQRSFFKAPWTEMTGSAA